MDSVSLADRFGTRRLIVAGMLLFMAVLLLLYAAIFAIRYWRGR
ncbi:MAG: hypothetical protein ABJC66_12350 [Gammaproteobacteria bacterium]